MARPVVAVRHRQPLEGGSATRGAWRMLPASGTAHCERVPRSIRPLAPGFSPAVGPLVKGGEWRVAGVTRVAGAAFCDCVRCICGAASPNLTVVDSVAYYPGLAGAGSVRSRCFYTDGDRWR